MLNTSSDSQQSVLNPSKEISTHSQRLHSNGGVVTLPDSFVHISILSSPELVLHHDIRPEDGNYIKQNSMLGTLWIFLLGIYILLETSFWYWKPLHSKLPRTIPNCGGDWLESPLQCRCTGGSSQNWRWIRVLPSLNPSLCITVTELPLCSLLQRISTASRGSGLSTKEEHKSQLNYYSTHEIDFCEKNRRGKDESSPSYQTNKKTAGQPFERNFQGSPSRLQTDTALISPRCWSCDAKFSCVGGTKGTKDLHFNAELPIPGPG